MSGIQYQLGPMSKVNPCSVNFLALPPGMLCCSNTVTFQPAFAIKQAEDKPAKPEPITRAVFKYKVVDENYVVAVVVFFWVTSDMAFS